MHYDLFAPSLTDFGKQVREKVLQWTGLTVGIGIGPTKVLAKLANMQPKSGLLLPGIRSEATPYSEAASRRLQGLGPRLRGSRGEKKSADVAAST